MPFNNLSDLLASAPLSLLALGILALLMIGAFTASARLTGLFTAAVLVVAALPWLLHQPAGQLFTTASGPLLSLTPYSVLAGLLALLLALLSLPPAAPFLEPLKAHKPEYYILLALSTLGALLLVTSSHFIPFYLGLELMSFPLYILAAFQRREVASAEAGLKYFVLGSLSSGLMLYGISLVYAQTGHLGFASIGTALVQAPSSPLLLIALALTGTGLFFKLSLVPFHMWTPDVYQGSPTPVTALMTGLPKLAAAVALVRLLNGPFASLSATWQPMLAAMSAFGMVAGSTLAILQTDIKRMMAWSTIAQIGFLMTGIVGSAGGTAGAGAHAALFYATVYGLTMLGLFGAVMAGGFTLTTQLKGLGGREPALAAALAAFLFSLAGIPPLAGFFSKFTAFGAAVAAGYSWLALVAVLCSVVAAFYSLWLVKLMYFDAPEGPTPERLAPWKLFYPLALAGAVLLLGIWPGILSGFTVPAALSIL